MRGLILAAGRGSRMSKLTDDRPKCLSLLDGQPLIAWQLAALTAAGAGEVGIVSGYRAEMLEGFGARRFHNPRWAETNMVRSLAAATEWLEAGDCLVSYGDIFYSPATVAALAAAPGEIAIAYDPAWLALWRRRSADPRADAETFARDPEGWLTEIGGRVADVEAVQGQYMGLLKFTPAGWAGVVRLVASLPAAAADRLDMTSLLRLALQAGTAIATVANRHPWGEVDTADDLALYHSMMAAGELPRFASLAAAPPSSPDRT